MSMAMMKQVMTVSLIAAAIGTAHVEAGQMPARRGWTAQPVPVAAAAPVPAVRQVPPAGPVVAIAPPAQVPPPTPVIAAAAPQIPPPTEPFIVVMPAMPPMPQFPSMESMLEPLKVLTSPETARALARAQAELAAMPPMPQLPPLDSMIEPLKALTTVEPAMALARAKMEFAYAMSGEQQADEIYREARELIDESKYEKALERLNRLVTQTAKERADAALYWKAYVLNRVGQRSDALGAIADMQKRFADSRWIKDAKALELEIRQSSGQNVSPESQNDDELKVMALRGIMQSDPDRALPMIEKLLAGTSSPKVKDNALFVLSQSRAAKAREILAGVAKNGNPDLQLRAIRYLGSMGIAENRQILDDVYRSSNDQAVKRSILRAFMSAGDRERLLGLAKSEKDEALRGEAVRQLGSMRAGPELAELYRTEQSVEVKKQILNGMFVGGQSDKLIELAKTEKDPELQRTAVRQLGSMRRTDTGDALVAIYQSSSNVELKKSIVNALFSQNNATSLVALARAEKSPEMKTNIVGKLSNMKSKEATDYLVELLGK